MKHVGSSLITWRTYSREGDLYEADAIGDSDRSGICGGYLSERPAAYGYDGLGRGGFDQDEQGRARAQTSGVVLSTARLSSRPHPFRRSPQGAETPRSNAGGGTGAPGEFRRTTRPVDSDRPAAG